MSLLGEHYNKARDHLAAVPDRPVQLHEMTAWEMTALRPAVLTAGLPDKELSYAVVDAHISAPRFDTFFLNLSTPLKLTNGSANRHSGS